MSYTVLARKFRSRTFDEVVGQKAVTTTLRNAIENNRIHHGYLFCGTRGVGKTSMARILAKCLNCLSARGPTIEPCGKCDSCQAIARGEDMDVIEIDAASNTGVDNIRELRSNAAFRPARARFKIYIIDEVHMLTTGAFNALLKTLEEPPEHVKFILATTESQKVPATIQSRVQRFDFKALQPGEIAAQIEMICKQEKVKTEEAAVKRIARLANGSMRDALSLLDQVLSMGGRVSTEIVDELLPAAHDELLGGLIDRLADGDPAAALASLDASLSQGFALDHWCTLLIAQIRDLMMLRICGADTDLVDVPAGLRGALVEQAGRFDPGAYVYMIAMLEELRRSVKSSGAGRALVEAAIVRLADASKFSSVESIIARLEGNTPSTPQLPRASASPVSRPASAVRSSVSPDEPKKKEVISGSDRAVMSELGNGAPVARQLDAVRSPKSITSGRTSAPMGSGGPSTAAREQGPGGQAAGQSGGRVTQAVMKAAYAEPIIRSVIDLFDGRIIDVQREPTVRPSDKLSARTPGDSDIDDASEPGGERLDDPST